jgi:hypothetical protein
MSESSRSQDRHSAVPDHTHTLPPLSVILDFFHRASSWSAARKFRNQTVCKDCETLGLGNRS